MSPVSPVSVIIPAAGASRRFSGGRRARTGSKLLSALGGKPLLCRSLEVFDQAPDVCEMIVAVPPGGQKQFSREILSQVRLRKKVTLVRGGKTRAESVWNALQRVSRRAAYVCVHDGARPLIQAWWLDLLKKSLNGSDGAVLGRPMVPTVKQLRSGTLEVEETLDRGRLFEAETPQLFRKKAFLEAYRLLGRRAFTMTDDASLVEAAGGSVKAVAHSEPNVKVTSVQDLAFVRKMVEGDGYRFGIGYDRHLLISKKPLYLGGLKIPSSKGSLGHSDGDALLHALVDGILGASGIGGDVGDIFPDRDPRWKGKRSPFFVRTVLQMIRRRGFRAAQVDANLIMDEPKLGIWKKKMAEHVALLLGIADHRVSVKAKTSEGVGAEADGRAVSAQVLVVLQPL